MIVGLLTMAAGMLVGIVGVFRHHEATTGSYYYTEDRLRDQANALHIVAFANGLMIAGIANFVGSAT